MSKLSVMQVEHKSIKAGYPVDGWGISTKRMIVESVTVKAVAVASGRSFGVHVNDAYVGTVYCMTGGQYAALDIQHNQVSTYTGHDAEIKCFIDLVLHVNYKHADGFPHLLK